MKTIRNILEMKKNTGVYTIHPLATTYEAVALLCAHNIGALVVSQQRGICGVFSERDCVQKLSFRERPLRHTQVCEVMDDECTSFQLSTTVQECMRYMTECQKRHVPVVECDNLIGLISIGDVVKAYIAESEFTINQLQTYIAS